LGDLEWNSTVAVIPTISPVPWSGWQARKPFVTSQSLVVDGGYKIAGMR
jgi:hypothetical protein